MIATALQYIKDGVFDESDIEDQPRPPRDGGPGAARNTSMSGKGGISLRSSTHSRFPTPTNSSRSD